MKPARKFGFWLRGHFLKGRFGSEMDEEMQHHLTLRIEKNIAAGMSPEEARYSALRAFGGLDQVKEQCRDQFGWPAAERVARDLRYAGRQMRRNPSFSAVVVLTFALGIAATVVIFSLAYGVLLPPLPYLDC
jgi:hypothetical protein